ncbi:hypothetical protein [Brumimicrobium aurantiacum]|uniref:Uncharacterized protein n=1 Tax=Brumimicrobium aurantiacum TaxID=1737063 RepID=A0A3E1F1G5_9FLAO|nr:hypothetical protein [Brumimicrobium aurantiacum]RFC55672.1 hypothetical protein DXU93_01690 [Brumimicrobium aurantiacum]
MKKLIYGGLFLALVGIGAVGCKKDSLKPESMAQSSVQLKNNKSQIPQKKAISDADQLREIHSEIIENPTYKNQEVFDQYSEEEILHLADINLDKIESIGAQNHLTDNGYREDFLDMIHYWYSLESSTTKYQNFLDMYQINNQDATLFFQAIEMNNAFIESAGLAAPSSGPCADAIISTVITTAGAIGVGGPLGLGIWLVSKGWSTYQLIKNCT